MSDESEGLPDFDEVTERESTESSSTSQSSKDSGKRTHVFVHSGYGTTSIEPTDCGEEECDKVARVVVGWLTDDGRALYYPVCRKHQDSPDRFSRAYDIHEEF